MTTTTAPDIPTALAALAGAGITPDVIARELGTRTDTVHGWRRGRRAPSPGSLHALRALVDHLLAGTLAGDTIADARQGAALQRAKDALVAVEQGPALAELAARVRRTMRASGALVSPEPDPHPLPVPPPPPWPGPQPPHVSVTGGVDAFDLCRDRAQERADAIDAAFGT